MFKKICNNNYNLYSIVYYYKSIENIKIKYSLK